MLVISIFSFSHNVFKTLLFQSRENAGLCSKRLTLYHTIPTLNNPKEEALENTMGEGENGSNQHSLFFPTTFSTQSKAEPAFSSFTTLFSILWKREIVIAATFNLPSANAFNLVLSKNLSIGKEFNHLPQMPILGYSNSALNKDIMS